MTPRISYARTRDGADIAYAVLGDGPLDVVWIPAWLSHLESLWQGPFAQLQGRMLERLASFARVVTFDKRGTGLSSRTSPGVGAEVWVDDLHAVLEATDMPGPVVWGDGAAGCAIGALYAAAHPERVRALVLWGPRARTAEAADYPLGWSEEEMRRTREAMLAGWGTEAYVRSEMAGGWGSALDDPAFVAHAARSFRNSATPGDAALLDEIWCQIDVRRVLPTVRVPTLVLARSAWRSGTVRLAGERAWGMARLVADLVPGARFVEVSGDDYPPWLGESDEVVSEVQAFVTGDRAPVDPDRVLVTVLFTDIVGSTRKASELGDRRWRELLAEHDARVRAELERHRGVEVDHAGDGFFATFDGPARAVRCAFAIGEAVAPLDLQVRAGCHTGEVERSSSGVRGIAVHLGARICAAAGASEVLVSSTVKELTAGSGLGFEDAGEHSFTGVPGSWRVFRARA